MSHHMTDSLAVMCNGWNDQTKLMSRVKLPAISRFCLSLSADVRKQTLNRLLTAFAHHTRKEAFEKKTCTNSVCAAVREADSVLERDEVLL